MTLAHHVVNIGPGGTFASSGAVHTRPADVDDLVDRIRDAHLDKVVLHFHGGLVSEAAGMRIAEQVLPTYSGAGAYGIAVVWETGLLETVSRNLRTLNRTKLFTKLVDYGIRHASKWLGAGVGARGPGALMTLEEVEAVRRTDAELERMDARARGGALLDADEIDAVEPELEVELQADLEADPEIETLLDRDEPDTALLDRSVVPATRQDGARSVITVVAVVKLLVPAVLRVLRRFAAHRDHGVVATVVEEVLRAAYLADLGAWIWVGMKAAADNMWLPNTGSVGESTHAGSYLLEKLDQLRVDRPRLTVDLVGHSAGAIAVCGLIDTAVRRHPRLRLRNVALLAPACTPEVFQRGIVAHTDRIARVRIFSMHDALERRDRLVRGVYPSSLLYFVSGVLESEPDCPIAGLDRHTSGSSPYRDDERLSELHRYLYEDGRDRLVLSTTEDGPAGLRSTAVTHGGFDNDALTLSSLAAMIAG